MKNILLANCLALLIGCDLPNVENSSAKFIEGEVIMEDFDSKNLLNWKIVNDSVMGGRSDATLKLNAHPINQSQLNNVLLAYPFMTLKVMGAIYWQAMRLLAKRLPFVSHPNKN